MTVGGAPCCPSADGPAAWARLLLGPASPLPAVPPPEWGPGGPASRLVCLRAAVALDVWPGQRAAPNSSGHSLLGHVVRTVSRARSPSTAPGRVREEAGSLLPLLPAPGGWRGGP